jgi:hypothetical protein
MKVTSKVLMVNIENNITLANGMIKLIVEHQVCLYESKNGGVGIDLEIMDYKDIEFMGMPVTDVKIFKTHLSGLGVDFNDMLDEECIGLFSNKDIAELKNMFCKMK